MLVRLAKWKNEINAVLTVGGKKMLGGSFLAVSNRILSTVIGFVTVPLTIGYLGKERYGLWMVALSVMSFTSFLDLGITPTIKNKMAGAYGRRDKLQFDYYKRCAVVIGLLICLIGIGIGILSQFINWADLLNVTDLVAREEAASLVSTLSILLMLSLGLGMVEMVFLSRLQINKVKIYALVSSLSSFVFLLLAIELKAGLPILALATQVGSILTRSVMLFELFLGDKHLVRSGFRSIAAVLREILPTSVLFMGVQFFAVFLSATPTLAIAQFQGLQEVASFSVAYKLVTLPLLAVAEVLPVFWPAFTIAWARGELKALRKTILGVAWMSAIAFSVYGLGLGIAGESIVNVWTFGAMHVESNLFYILSCWLIVQGPVYWLSTFLHSISDFKFELASYGLTAFMLVLGCIGVGEELGSIGVGIIMLVSLGFGSFLPMILRTRYRLAFVGR